MHLVQLQYWITLFPGMLATETMSLPKGGHLMGVWALTLEDLTRNEVLNELKSRYVQPLNEIKQVQGLNVHQALELSSLRQVRKLLNMRKKEELPDITTLQHVELLEDGHISIVHNVQLRAVGECFE
jgi:hypothetical protein